MERRRNTSFRGKNDDDDDDDDDDDVWLCFPLGELTLREKPKGSKLRCLEATNSREDFGDINSAWRAGWDSRKTQSQIPAVSGSPVCQSIAPKWSRDRLNTSRKSHQSDAKGNCIELKLSYLSCWMPNFFCTAVGVFLTEALFKDPAYPSLVHDSPDETLGIKKGWFPTRNGPIFGPNMAQLCPRSYESGTRQDEATWLPSFGPRNLSTNGADHLYSLRSHPAFQGCQGARAHWQPQPLLLFCWLCEPKYAAVVNLAYPTGLHGRQNAPCAGDWG